MEIVVSIAKKNFESSQKTCEKFHNADLMSVDNAAKAMIELSKHYFKPGTLIRFNGIRVGGQWQDLDGNPIDVSGITIQNEVDGGTLTMNPNDQR